MLSVNHLKRWCGAHTRHLFLNLLLMVLLAGVALTGGAAEPQLTLGQAIARTLAANPDLQVFDLRLQGLEGRRLTAEQSPGYELGVEVENILGSGTFKGADAVEYTLSLSSVVELGGKRLARSGLVASQFSLTEAEREADTLNVLGQVTQGFVAALALQEKLKLAADAVELAQTTHDIVALRASRGATPAAEVLRARSALTQSRIEKARLQIEYDSRKVALAALWGESSVDFPPLAGDLFHFGASDSFETLYRQASENPMIQVYASEQRLREAEVQLARSQSQADIRWQVGMRRLEETGDSALVAGLSMPLFADRRNRGAVQSAIAAQDEVEYRKRGALVRLHGRLFEAWSTRQHSIDAVNQIRGQMLPDLTRALGLTQGAYESGRYSYVEWVAAQRELLSARVALVDAATAALLNQALIEQLTAQPMAASPSALTR